MGLLRHSGTSHAVVLSDFRIGPLLAAVDLYLRHPNSEFLLSTESLSEGDYGDDVDESTRGLVFDLLTQLFRVTVCSSTKADQRNIDESACMSSLISLTNDSNATRIRYPNLWEKCVRLARGAQAVRREILQGGYANVFVFNGRTASTRAPTKLPRKERSPQSWVYEYGVSPGFYRAQQTPIFDRIADGDAMVAWAESVEFLHSKLLARRAISDKLNNDFRSALSESPEASFDTIVFSGSPHEYLWWGRHKHSGLDSDLVSFVRQVRALNLGVPPICIRLHPNMVNDPALARTLNELESVFGPGELKVISPHSNWSSYELIDQASTVIVAGSSIALDSLYLGKMPVLMEDNEISKMITASSTKFDHVSVVAENVAGLMREFEMRKSIRPSLGTLGFLIAYSFYLKPPGLPFLWGFLRGVAKQIWLEFLSIWRASRRIED